MNAARNAELGDVLLVDDEESVLVTLGAVLEQEGYRVTAADSGAKALETLRQKRFDLLLTDLRIDEVDGLTLLAAAQKRDPEIICIMLTGYASLESAVQALRHGAFNYLLKPCNIDEMKLTIARGLEKKRLAEALRDRVVELEQANETIRSFSAHLEEEVRRATAELADRVRDLQASRTQLSAVIDSMEDGLIVYQEDGRALRANGFFLRFFGLEPGEVQGRTPTQVAELTREPVPDVADTNPVTFELPGSPQRFVRRVVSPVISKGLPNGLGFVVLYQDVTDQKAVEQLKDDFLSIASHELKTPLTSILGYTQLLSRRLPDNEKVAGRVDMLDAIENQGKRMKRLVDDLLDVSKIERGALTSVGTAVELGALVCDVVGKQAATSERHKVRLTAPAERLVVWGDQDRLEQVILNLVGNAIKYSPDGGEVLVSLRRNGEQAEVAVEDHGIGISADQLPRIFSRFYQVESVVRSRRFGGMGLGLFISKAIVDELGGTISAESEVSKGSVFRFALPLYTE